MPASIPWRRVSPTFWKKPTLMMLLGTLKISPVESVRKRPTLQSIVPAGSVVVPSSLPAADGRYSLYCAVIVKRVDAQTRAKTSINELLRSAETT